MGGSSRSKRRRWSIVLATTATAGAIGLAGLLGGAPWLFGVLAGALVGAASTLAVAGVPAPGRGAGVARDDASIDPVTGLPSAERLLSDLGNALGRGYAGQMLSLFLFSLDGFKDYNDAYGDACGDTLLGWLARKLHNAVSDYGNVYRTRGGSFALLAGGSERFTTALCASAASALHEIGEGFQISCDVGAAHVPTEVSSPEAALELATRRARKHSTERLVRSGRRAPADPQQALRLVRPREEIAALAACIAHHLGLPSGEIPELESAVHLCDVGNVAVPRTVLTHPGKLLGHEWQFILLHTLVGERLLAGGLGMDGVARLVRSSHERWDGAGYPDGLAGEAIPLGSRIVFVCSAFHDMTSDRPHHAALELADALAQLELGAGTQFDPEVVRAFREELATGLRRTTGSPARI